MNKDQDHRQNDDAETLINGLREMCGYVENGTETTVRIGQDDATKEWIVWVGKRWFHGSSMRGALRSAIDELAIIEGDETDGESE